MTDIASGTSQFKINANFDEKSGVLKLRFSGALTETFPMEKLQAYFGGLVDPQSAVMDLEHVSYMNSEGVRQWILFLQALPRGLALEFDQLSEIFVQNLNLVQNLIGTPPGKVNSFFAPYNCRTCQKRHLISMRPEQIHKNADGKPSTPHMDCLQCGKAMEFDEIPEEYLYFAVRS